MSELSADRAVASTEDRSTRTAAVRRHGVRQMQYVVPHVLLGLGGLIMLFPFAWQILMSLSTDAEITAVPPHPLPDIIQWHNYVDVFSRLPFLQQFWVSVLITVIRTVTQLFLCSLAGYAFARMRFRGKDLLFGLLLVILMVPSQAYLIPQYQIIKNLQLLDTTWGIVLPGMFSAFATFLLRVAFMGIPTDLEDAARLDGCNPWQVFWRVMLPLVTPSLFAVAITTVLWSWNDLLWPLVVTTKATSMPLSVGIATLAGQTTKEYAIQMAASVMAMAPIFLVFFSMQRRVIEGLARSGLKG